ncbi:zinc finger BED domain-containing protein 1-like [Trematomus bernacchii]|uniref:zinc finger BED domain-containing protein 1-like n=1 Tax=Trematomus bernacchii TaxID=40690 RepID=UPI00146C4E21|nr:zinc finger BED domain-containing protein 1-like [Trematomus bernacchii]
MEGGESSVQIIKNAPSVLKADIWTHYGFYELKGKSELDKSHAVFKVCHTKIKYLGGNTTNLRNHLSRFHCEKLTPATKKTAEPAQRRIDEALSTFPPNSEKAKKITQSVAAFIAKDLRPYSVVENTGFRHLLKTLEPRYKLPSCSHFTENVIPALYNGTKAQVMASMIQAKRVAITCDAWTSVATESYLTVTAHYISEDWQFLSHVLQTRAVYESHTGAHVAELLSRVVEEWQLSDKDVVLVTDNASNMIVAAEFGKFPHVKCFAHTLNLASQRALKVATLSRLLGRVRRISTFFHRSTTANHYLKEKQKCLGLKNHKLITDVATRWNSAYDMVERFLEQQPAICATLLSPEVRKGQSDLCTLNETDVSNAEDAVSALKPMKDATTLMSEESNPTVSLIAPIIAQLFQDMTGTIGDSPMIHAIKNAIKTDLLKSGGEIGDLQRSD